MTRKQKQNIVHDKKELYAISIKFRYHMHLINLKAEKESSYQSILT